MNFKIRSISLLALCAFFIFTHTSTAQTTLPQTNVGNLKDVMQLMAKSLKTASDSTLSPADRAASAHQLQLSSIEASTLFPSNLKEDQKKGFSDLLLKNANDAKDLEAALLKKDDLLVSTLIQKIKSNKTEGHKNF